MQRLSILLPLALVLATPAFAAPGQEPRQTPTQQQTHKADYWLSRDMQRLVFWQSREPEAQSGDPSAH